MGRPLGRSLVPLITTFPPHFVKLIDKATIVGFGLCVYTL